MKQKEALDILKTGASVFLTGEPGSGKSHIIREYINYLKEHKIECAVTASTGIAATHIGGTTIHSWSGVGIRKWLSDYDLDRIATNPRTVKRIRATKVLIVDEISMLDSNVLDCVERVCREIKQNEEPFGGIQVVLVGDFFQLPPISKEEDEGQFAFNANAWSASRFFVCYLTEQFRQEDQEFIAVLSAMRRNAITPDHTASLDTRCLCSPENDSSITRLFSKNVDVDRLNEEELNKIHGTPKKYHMQSSGRPFLIEQLKKNCLSPETLVLKKGAVVMFTKNSPKGDFVNGTIGRVVDFNLYNNNPIIKTLGGKIIETEPMDWTIEENNRVLARIFQMPLRLAWALTVHKSQGMSLDAAYIDLRDAFVEGQGYVALSRVRSLKGLYLAGYNPLALQVHPEILEKDEFFRSKSDDIRDAFRTIPENELAKMHKNFVLAFGGVWPDANDSKKKNHNKNVSRRQRSSKIQGWEEKDDESLLEHYGKGESIEDIARLLKRKPAVVRARIKKIGLDI